MTTLGRKIGIILIYLLLIANILGCTAPLADDKNEIDQEDNPTSIIEKNEELEEGLFKGDLSLPFTLQDMEGVLKGIEDYRGKLVFLNFWSNGCSLCVEELITLEGFFRENQQEAVVISINIGGEKQEVDRFIQEHQLSFPVLLDKNREVANAYHIQSTPTTYVIDKNGIIRNIHLGPMDRTKIETYQQEALKNYK